MRSERAVTVRFEGDPSILDKAALFICYACKGDGCDRCADAGFVRCAHPVKLLGHSFVMGDDEVVLSYARCAGCGSHVRDPREHAGQDATQPFHTANGADADEGERSQIGGRV